MTKPSDYLPPDMYKNANVGAFLKVIDGMQVKKEESVLVYENMLNPYTSKDISSIRNFFFEAGQIPILSYLPMFLWERFLLNAYNLFEQVGSLSGLKDFIWATIDGELLDGGTFTIITQKYLMPNNLDLLGMLPDGQMLTIAANNPYNYPFLFDFNFAMYYGEISFGVASDYIDHPETRREWIQFLPNFLPMCSPGSTNITVSFYKVDGTFLETLNI